MMNLKIKKIIERKKVIKVLFILIFIVILSTFLNFINLNQITSDDSKNENLNHSARIKLIVNEIGETKKNVIEKVIKKANSNNNNDDNNEDIIDIIMEKKEDREQFYEELDDLKRTESNECGKYIDLVYTWVNGSDPNHKKSKAEYFPGYKDFHRFRDIGGLKYSLRSVRKYAPWIRDIYIITANQIPDWFDKSNPENVKFLFHQDIYRNISHLPTFNSNSIEANFGNFPENTVSNCFLYLNDDVFFRKPVYKEDYFNKYGDQFIYEKSEDFVNLSENEKTDSYTLTFIRTNRALNKIWNESRHRTWPDHGIQVFKKSIWEIMYQTPTINEMLIHTSSNRKRDDSDTPISFLYNQFAKRYAEGTQSAPNRMNLYVGAWNDLNNQTTTNAIFNILKENNTKTVCFNDGYDYIDKFIYNSITNLFEHLFPIKSPYELY